ncbi:MAG: lipoyl(octanoyl) transferase LipB [Gammaproteobacteria bacterium]
MNARLQPVELPVLRDLGCVDYVPTWQAMRAFTDTRSDNTRDEIWFLEHPPVFTLGQAARPEHVLAPGAIPVIRTDRGGQVTYHGPGQLVVYPLVDLRRLHLGVRALVAALEQSVLLTLWDFDIQGFTHPKAPGVYSRDGGKLASLGLRVRRGCTYHGLAFNIGMDLEPFERINPCGYPGLKMTQVKDLGGPARLAPVAARLKSHLVETLGYNWRRIHVA